MSLDPSPLHHITSDHITFYFPTSLAVPRSVTGTARLFSLSSIVCMYVCILQLPKLAALPGPMRLPVVVALYPPAGCSTAPSGRAAE